MVKPWWLQDLYEVFCLNLVYRRDENHGGHDWTIFKIRRGYVKKALRRRFLIGIAARLPPWIKYYAALGMFNSKRDGDADFEATCRALHNYREEQCESS